MTTYNFISDLLLSVEEYVWMVSLHTCPPIGSPVRASSSTFNLNISVLISGVASEKSLPL